jgi:hypothetical protein
MKTERLRQFPAEYEAINSVKNPDERVILKQVIFMQFEKILKKQAKVERKKKKKALKAQKEELLRQAENKINVSNSKNKNGDSASKRASMGGEL